MYFSTISCLVSYTLQTYLIFSSDFSIILTPNALHLNSQITAPPE